MASPNQGHLTELEAINDMLWSIGESPVLALDSGLGDAATAESLLFRVSREIQAVGWHVNTLRGDTLTLNADNQFVLPVNTLSVDTVNASSHRKISTPRPSAHINAAMRRSADDTMWLMYDLDNEDETWSNETELTVDIVQFLNFANLTPKLQMYIWTKAARRFQAGSMGSSHLDQFTDRDVREAMLEAVQEDLAHEDVNMYRDNLHARQITFRNNPGYNT